MIKPINGHLLIEPVKHETFMASEKGTYEEIGKVIELPATGCGSSTSAYGHISVGDSVYFDSWLAAKYPTGNGNDFFWLVPYKDIRAIDHGD